MSGLNPEIEEEDRKREELAPELAWCRKEKARARRGREIKKVLTDRDSRPIHSLKGKRVAEDNP